MRRPWPPLRARPRSSHRSLRRPSRKLPPRLRQVFLLRHYVGMKIGADNPADDPEGEVTIARRYGRSGRTIRNWLKEADALLAGFRENENGE